VSTYFSYGAWLKNCQADRVTICYNIDEPASLIERLVELEDLPGTVSLDFVFPSARFRDAVGLTGPVEYALPDLDHFRPAGARTGKPGPLLIGRHSRDHRLKFHPNDLAFFRQLAGLGHTLRITGGICLAGALGNGKMAGSIALLPETQSGVVEFLDGLDCFVYRIHPHLFETGGTVIVEAMAMSLPVILFGEQVGVAELIDHGENGFLVDTEEEALECIAKLAADPELRRAIGAAARATIGRILEAQGKAMLDFYLLGDASAPSVVTELPA
jgi:glycosyltransferase involved in cell wall biosynthesis